jgi:hypothetical protein
MFFNFGHFVAKTCDFSISMYFSKILSVKNWALLCLYISVYPTSKMPKNGRGRAIEGFLRSKIIFDHFVAKTWDFSLSMYF